MNARFLARLFSYKNTPLALKSAHNIIAIKTERQNFLLRHFGLSVELPVIEGDTQQNLMLAEGRAAQKYWRLFRTLLPGQLGFSRKAHAPDLVNRLLDIGYHHLTNKVRAILTQYHIPSDIGLLHEPHKSDSAPLAYDLVELFRADVIDAEVLRYLRLKKRLPSLLFPREIARFLVRVNTRIGRHYYLKDFGLCYAYSYYMEVQILRLERAITHKGVFTPLHLPVRHEGRCGA